MSKGFTEIINPPKEDPRTADEIKASFLEYFGAKEGEEL